ncbi:ParM/StbA family protein [Cyanobacteria bacterium FACHB-502]|nr:ParM/StbA family protein [Cyanobacteria bacterium FACHB-502]
MQSAKLQIGFDPGASLSKIVYSVNGAPPKILMMEPDVLNLPTRSVNQINLTARPEDQAWIKLNQNAERIQVCGFLAREFSAVERIEMLKYEHAFYKFLAAVGAIALQEGTDRVAVDAAMLLPYGEINSRGWLKEKISKSLKKYYFQHTLIRGQLVSYHCASEGTGMMCHLIRKHGMDWISQNRISILIFGYRNISCLTLNRGVIETCHSATTDLGFVKLIDKVIARTPGQNRYALVEAVYALGSDLRTDHRELQFLIRSTQPENIHAEAKLLVDAIEIARYEYWQLVQDWLNAVVPDDLNHLIISGGTSIYLKPFLEKHFEWATPEWLASHSGELSQSDPCLQSRFGDVMTLFESRFQLEKAA